MAKTPRSQCSRVLVREVDPTNCNQKFECCNKDRRSCKTQRRQINKQNKHKINTKKKPETTQKAENKKSNETFEIISRLFTKVIQGREGTGSVWDPTGQPHKDHWLVDLALVRA